MTYSRLTDAEELLHTVQEVFDYPSNQSHGTCLHAAIKRFNAGGPSDPEIAPAEFLAARIKRDADALAQRFEEGQS